MSYFSRLRVIAIVEETAAIELSVKEVLQNAGYDVVDLYIEDTTASSIDDED